MLQSQMILKFIDGEKFNEFEVEHAFYIKSSEEAMSIPTKGTLLKTNSIGSKMYEVRYKLLNVAQNGNELIPSYLFERVFDKK